jgi:hypothetical protein
VETTSNQSTVIGLKYTTIIPQQGEDIMNTLMTHVFTDMRESLGAPKTAMKEEHVDALVRFVFAMASKMPDIKNAIRAILAVPKADAPCLNMKSKFKLEDALKV